ncbi:MAG: hypothetical protein HOI95_06590 [Chromatiales bacterium]|jgi:hypothetical protein|nr:hypothetical protein [Chromatiales bacterium]
MNEDQQTLHDDALRFIDRFLSHAIDDASVQGENPAVVLYGLLECAVRVSQAHFPEHAQELYASATQMVFESHYGDGSQPN